MSDGFQSAFLAGAAAAPHVPDGFEGETAGVYLRYSHDHSNPRSLDQQLNNVLERAAREGAYVPWEWVFGDSAVTGTTAARTGYQMAKSTMAERTGPAMIIIDELGRASRNAIEALELGKFIQGLGKRLVGATDGLDTNAAFYKIMLTVFAMLQEWFIDQLKDEVNRGLDDAFDGGMNIFGTALGYKLIPRRDDDGNLILGRNDKPLNRKVVDEVEAAFVILILNCSQCSTGARSGSRGC